MRRFDSDTVENGPGGGGVLPYMSLMGTCGQSGYVFRDFCLKQGIEFVTYHAVDKMKNSTESRSQREDDWKTEHIESQLNDHASYVSMTSDGKHAYRTQLFPVLAPLGLDY